MRVGRRFWEENQRRKGKGKGKERKKKGKKEKKERRKGGLMAGHGRWSPAAAGGGQRRSESGSPSNHGGASLAHLENLEFCKKDIGERSNSSLERALRGEEDGVVHGGQGGVGGGENGGKVLEVNGLFS